MQSLLLLSKNFHQKSRYLIIGLFLAFSTCINAQNSFRSYLPDQSGWLRETEADFTKLLLNVSFEPEKGLVKGKVSHTFTTLRERTDSMFFDAPEISIKEVLLDGMATKTKTSKEGLTVYFAVPLKMSSNHIIDIVYEATPKRGIYFIGWNDPTGRCRKQIWTQGEATDNRYWIPMHDDFYDKVITESIVHFPSKYKVLANGKLLEQKKEGNDIVWHYKMLQPHAVYLIMLGIGEYDIYKSKSKGGVELINYMYPDQKDRTELTYFNTGKFMDFFEKETGVKYPWGAYSQIPVQDFIYGAMENTSATIFGDFFNVDKAMFPNKNYKSVNAHEMAHQWFGDIITCRSGRHMWLNESFATHYQKKAEQESEGNDYFENNRYGEMQSVLNAGTKDNFPIVHSSAGTSRIYQKGSLVLDMMRNVAGNENYRKTITYYLNKFKFQNVTSYDLLISFHDAVGLDMTWFWEQWLFKGGEPHYKVQFTSINSSLAEFKVQQIQKRDETVGLFKMPIIFKIFFKDGSFEEKKQWIERETEILQIPINPNKVIDYVLFDPSHSIISNVSFEKSFEMLSSQALKASSFYDRYEAILALKTVSIEKKQKTLLDVYEKEGFYTIKAEILSQLSKGLAGNNLIISTFKNALESKDAQIRNAASQYFELWESQTSVKLLKNLLNDSASKVVETTLGKLCEKLPAEKESFLSLTSKYTYKDGPIRLTWLKYQILYQLPFGYENKDYKTSSKNPFVDELVDLSSSSYEFRTRKQALETCLELSIMNRELFINLTDAMISKNSRLKLPAMDVFKQYKSNLYHKKAMNAYYEGLKSTWQKEKLDELKGLFD